jgi:hypothetical protein
MASSANDILYLDLTETSVDAANNRSLVHWKVRLYCDYAVSATQSGNAYVNGSLVWNYSGNPGYLATGSTTMLAEGDIWIGHDGSGNGTVSGTAHLQTTTSGYAWSFNKNASNSIGLTHITLASAPGAPGWAASSSPAQDSLSITWTTPANNGAAIDVYEWRVWDGAHSWASPNVAGQTSATSAAVGGLWPGSRYYWGVMAHNSQGWGSPSNTGTGWWVDTLRGAWVRVGGTWRMAKVWVRAGGTWRLAKVWKRSGGVWQA